MVVIEKYRTVRIKNTKQILKTNRDYAAERLIIIISYFTQLKYSNSPK